MCNRNGQTNHYIWFIVNNRKIKGYTVSKSWVYSTGVYLRQAEKTY